MLKKILRLVEKGYPIEIKIPNTPENRDLIRDFLRFLKERNYEGIFEDTF